MPANPFIKYFKQTVEQDDGFFPRRSAWGKSAIYYETSEEGFVGRQIQLFESGTVLVYDETHNMDDYGMMQMEPVGRFTPNTTIITSKDFHLVWPRHVDAINRQQAG
ncbi:MAG TPA: hypothetical protein VGH19_13040 [Verrucomicrobiae bacterium]